MDQTQTVKAEELQPTSSPNSTIDVSDIRTVKISNVSPSVSERDIFEFFTFSGEITYVEMLREDEDETTQIAYVTFRDSQGADTAALLTGSKVAGLPVAVTLAKNYQLPPNATLLTSAPNSSVTGSAMEKAEDVVSTMLAKGFVLGKDALKKAKSFDEKHQLTSNASATVVSIDRKIGLSEKLSMGTAVVNEKVREMDELLQVSEMTKSALAAAEQKASSAGSAIMSNQYVSAGASWVTNALSAVSKAAGDVGVMTKEKVEKAEEEKRETLEKEKAAIASDFINACPDIEEAEEEKREETSEKEKAAIASDSINAHPDIEKAEEEKTETLEKEKAAVASDFINARPDESPALPVSSSDETNKHV